LWHSDNIGMEAVLGYCLGEFAERAKGRMENIVGEGMPTTWCGSILKMRVVAEVDSGLAPSFFWILVILGNLFVVFGVTAMVHAVRRLKCASAMTSTSTCHATPLLYWFVLWSNAL
jgi:hypothetical protein